MEVIEIIESDSLANLNLSKMVTYLATTQCS